MVSILEKSLLFWTVLIVGSWRQGRSHSCPADRVVAAERPRDDHAEQTCDSGMR